MALPKPEPGLVIRYGFLWEREAARGGEDGKDRPCAVVLATKKEGEQTQVVVAPITHTDPGKGPAVEIPAATKQRLGLDHERSWIITNEVNVFEWPGPDLRPVSQGRRPADRFAYGMLPPKTLTAMVQGVLEQRRLQQLSTVRRDETPPPQKAAQGDGPQSSSPAPARHLWKGGSTEEPKPGPEQTPDRKPRPRR